MNKIKSSLIDITNIRKSIFELSKMEDETERTLLRHQLFKAFHQLSKNEQMQVKSDFALLQKEIMQEAQELLKNK